MKEILEILAPVGNEEMLHYACRAGADAVYLGIGTQNARASADNFDEETLSSAINYAHARGVRVYVALNTLLFDNEIDAFIKTVRLIAKAGADAAIVQDLGVASFLKQHVPALPLHASTQMSAHSVSDVTFLKNFGFTRVVLARELSAEEIKKIKTSVDIETEVFVHGAHCMSVSGQCTMSSMIGGRSGNRGRCAQPCRLPFSPSWSVEEFSLSLRDLSLLSEISSLMEIGVTSIKIEGRMKRPEYVASAVKTARLARAGDPTFSEAQAQLELIFSRSGFTDGFYKNRVVSDMFGTRTKENVLAAKEALPLITNEFRKEVPLTSITMSYHQVENEPISLSLSDGMNTVKATGDLPEKARNKGTNSTRVFQNLRKLGDTHYVLQNDINDITFTLDDTLAVPVSSINALRREAVIALDTIRTSGFEKEFLEHAPLPHKKTLPHTPVIRARFRTAAQIPFNSLEKYEFIYVPLAVVLSQAEKLSKYKSSVIVEPPRAKFRAEERILADLAKARQLGFTHMCAMTVGDIHAGNALGFVMHGGFSLNLVNSLALQEAANLGLSDTELSLEMDLSRANRLTDALPIGAITYGATPVMLTRNCPHYASSKNGCADCSGESIMYDRLENAFPFACNSYHTATEIFNCKKIMLSDRQNEFSRFSFQTLYFTFETPEEVQEITQLYQNHSDKLPSDYTRGMLYRPIL